MSLTQEQIEQFKIEHEPTILRTMHAWRAALQAEGFRASEPFDMHDECFRWDMAVYDNETEDGDPIADISVTIAESAAYDGSLDEHGNSEGVTLISDIVAFGGAIWGGFLSYNYSDRVWTDDPDEFRDRVRMLTGIDPSSVVDCVLEHAK